MLKSLRAEDFRNPVAELFLMSLNRIAEAGLAEKARQVLAMKATEIPSLETLMLLKHEGLVWFWDGGNGQLAIPVISTKGQYFVRQLQERRERHRRARVSVRAAGVAP